MAAMDDGTDTDAMGGKAPVRASIDVGVVVERRASQNRWIDETWMPVSVIAGAPVGEPWRLMREADGVRSYLARVLTLTLHRSEVESYRLNLGEPVPRVFVVMTPAEEGAMPYEVLLVTCASYEAEEYLTGGDAIVEPVPMPPELLAWVADFIDMHGEPDTFVKRQRDTAPALVEHKFGKDPIFEKTGRYASGKGDGDDG